MQIEIIPYEFLSSDLINPRQPNYSLEDRNTKREYFKQLTRFVDTEI